jgi:hypothetical protein
MCEVEWFLQLRKQVAETGSSWLSLGADCPNVLCATHS